MAQRPETSFGAVLDRDDGVGAGFDTLRLALAVTIFFCHANWAADSLFAPAIHSTAQPPGIDPFQLDLHATSSSQESILSQWKTPFYRGLVPMFFALSGFLVTASALRLRNTGTFLAFRALRIFPALAVEVTLSALVLGPLLTVLPLITYFSDPKTWHYFGNIIGEVHFDLPGVFENNPWPRTVNINLWTLPAEFYCYLITAFAMAVGIFYRTRFLTAMFAVVTLTFVFLNTITGFGVPKLTYEIYVVTYYFFVGVMFYLWRGSIPLRSSWFVVSAVLSYLFLLLPHTTYLAPAFVTYCTLYVGVQRLPKVPFLSSGDYSYGIYLYGFPFTQALVAMHPVFRGSGLLTAVVALAATIAFAFVSWRFIEKPALSLKKRIGRRRRPAPQTPHTPQGAGG